MSIQLANNHEVDVIIVDYNTDFNTIKNNTKIQFSCKNCGRTQSIIYRKSNVESIRMFLCTNCKKKHTTMIHYGVENPAQSQAIKDKMKSTCLERYGVEYSGASSIHKQKLSNTWSSKTRSEKQSIMKKIRQTKLDRYGDENYVNSEKARTTCLEKYGTDVASKSEVIKNKTKRQFIEKYGFENPGQVPEIKEKIKNTFFTKYGDYFVATEAGKKVLSDAINKKYGSNAVRVSKYKYNDILFDSSWELAFYIFHIESGYNITRPTKPFKYDYKGVIHNYYPDFDVNGKLYEIKGTHFWKNDGTMICPYDSRKNELYEAKHQCGLKNGVTFLTIKEIKPYIEYIKEKYGKGYLNNFKVYK